jgi:Transmembrane domain of unknown function (DUF3566)
VTDSTNPAAGYPTSGGNRSYGPSGPGSPTSALSPAQPGGAGPGLGASGLGATASAPAGSQPAGPNPGSGFARVGAAFNAGVGSLSRPGSSAATGQVRVRKARLRVARVDPWSVMKVSFVLSIAMGIVTIIGTAVVWVVLSSLGVFSSLNRTIGDLTSSDSTTTSSGASSFSLSSFLSFGHVEGYMIIIALVDIVLVTALATLGSYLYNLASGFVGGFEVTLAEDQ